MRLSVLSTQEVMVPVYATLNGAAYNPTGDSVYMAFTNGNAEPTSEQWNSGSWSTSVQAGITTYFAMCLVGPANGGNVVEVGNYSVWVKITDNPEVPIMPSGILSIF